MSAQTSTGYHADAMMPKDIAGRPLFLTVAAQAPGDGLVASLALTGIDTEPLAPVAATGGAAVLFDGHLGGRFVTANSWGGRFADQAQLTDRGLLVDVPAGNGWGRVGIVSPDPLIWLDDPAPGARSDVDFTFDPQRTSGVYLVLSPAGLTNPGDPGNPEASSIRIHWRQKADGTGARLSASIAGPETVILDQDMPPTPPDHILVSLSLEGVRLAVGDTVTDRVPVPGLTPGVGFRIWALSMSEAEGAPVRMGLKRITANRVAGQPIAASSNAAQGAVPPLPLRPLFPAGADVWERVALAGGDVGSFMIEGPRGIAVAVPPGHSWGKTGLLSVAPVLTLDGRLRSTPALVAVDVDPLDRAASFIVALSGERTPEMWPSWRLWTSFSRRDDGGVDLTLDWGGGRQWVKRLRPDDIPPDWSGRLLIWIGSGWSAVSLGDTGPRIAAPISFEPGQALFMTALAHAPAENAPASLVLRGISVGMATPPEMDAVSRFWLEDDQDFDPAAFLTTLGEDTLR